MITSTPLAVTLIAISTLCLALTGLVLSRARRTPGAGALAVQLLGIALWTLAFGIASLDLDPGLRSRVRDVGAVGNLIAPTALAWFLARFSGRDAWLTRPAIASLTVANVCLGLVFATNPSGLLNPSALPGHDPLVREFGPAYWAGILWVTLLLLIATVTIVRHRRHATPQQRTVSTVLIAATLMPWTMSFLRLRHIEFWHVDPVLVGMLSAAAGCAYAVLRGFEPDIEGIARAEFVRNISDGVVVIDEDGVVAVLNARAAEMLGASLHDAVGRNLMTIVDDERAWRDCLTGSAGSAEVRDGLGERMHVRAEHLPLHDRRGRAIGTTILMRDVTTLHTDPLTGIANRRCFHESAPESVEVAIANHEPVSIVAIDLDNLKLVNDSWGHHAGDRALGTVATTMRDALRVGDRIMRLGGDEFVALLPAATPHQAAQVVERMRSLVEELHLGVTITAGIAEVPSSDDLLRSLTRADQALYQAKRLGRNRVMLAEPVPA